MKHEDVKIGMKVVPHSKSKNANWEEWCMCNYCGVYTFLLENGYLYVTYVKENEKEIRLSQAINGLGDWFIASDFEPYNENKTQTTKKENKQMEPKQLTQKEITQQAKRERGKKIKELREKIGVEKVLKNGHTMIFFFKDGTKVVEQCQPEDSFDYSVAFALAYIHHIAGSKALYIEAVDKMIEQNMTVIHDKNKK